MTVRVALFVRTSWDQCHEYTHIWSYDHIVHPYMVIWPYSIPIYGHVFVPCSCALHGTESAAAHLSLPPIRVRIRVRMFFRASIRVRVRVRARVGTIFERRSGDRLGLGVVSGCDGAVKWCQPQ